MELLADALSYIELNLCETITAESVARNCFCSKSGLEKLFRNVYHYGVKEYVIKRRITKAARELVRYPEATVLDIALRYSYQSHEAFTRAFQQVWGCSPSVFRKEKRLSLIHIFFCYGPMYGILMAFKDYNISKGIWGSPWAGLKHFRELVESDVYKRQKLDGSGIPL